MKVILGLFIVICMIVIPFIHVYHAGKYAEKKYDSSTASSLMGIVLIASYLISTLIWCIIIDYIDR